MTNRVLIKRSSVANSVPSASALEYGELALNYSDGNLFFKNSGNVVTTLVSTQFVNVSGNVTGNYFFGNGSQLTGVVATTANAESLTGTFLPNNVVTSNLTTVGVLGTLSVTGNANVGNLGTTGNVTAGYFLGNGSQLTGILTTANAQTLTGTYLSANVVGSSLTSVGTLGNLSVSGNANVGNIGATNIVGTLTTPSQTNITSIGTLDSLNVTGNANVGNVGATGVVATNLTGTLQTASQTNITAVGTLGALSVTGNISAGNVSGTLLTGTLTTAAQPNITSVGSLSSLSVTGNANVGNIGATNGVFTNITGTLTTAAQPNITSVGTLTSLTVNGQSNYTGNVNITGNLAVTGNLNYQNVTDLIVGDPLIFIGANNNANLFDLGEVTQWNDGTLQYGGIVRDASDGVWKVFGNVSTEPTTTVDFTNAVYQPFRSGAATFANANINGALTGATSGAFSGNVTTGNVSGTTGAFTNIGGTLTTASQTNITSVGTLTSLNVTGNANVGNIGATNIVGTLTTPSQTNITAVGTLGALSVTGNISAGNISGTLIGGTLTTAAQPNVTSVGTLGSLNVSGNANVGNIGATNIVGTLTTASQTNITAVGTLGTLNVTGNANVGNLGTSGNITAGYFVGNGSQLTGVVASSANAQTLTGTFLANNVVTSNLTSVGSLTSLTVTGNANVGNIGATNLVATNLTGTVLTNAQHNITSVGTLGNLNVTGNANVGNIGATNAVITNSLSAGNITASGNVSATYFKGDGSYLTGLYGVIGEYYFANIASDVSPYYQDVFIANYVPGNVATATLSVGGTAVLLAEFLTNAGYPNQTYLPVGAIIVDYETQKGGGNSVYLTYAEIWKRTAAGVETLLLTSDVTSSSSVNTLIQQSVSITNTTAIALGTTDRIAIKIYAQVITGPTASIALRWDANTGSGLHLPAPPTSITQFIPYQNAVSNVALGSYGLSAGYLTTAGNATVGNLDVGSGNVFSGNLIATDVIFSSTMVATGNVTAIGNVSANYFVGNGSQLTGLSSNSIYNGNSNVSITSASANVTMGINGDANTVVISPGSIFVNGLFASPKTITSNVQMAEDSTAIIISPLTIASGYSMTVPTSSTLYVWIPS